MEKSDRHTLRSVRPPASWAAELEALPRDALPADLRPLLAKGRSREYYEGLLIGCAHAPRVARLIEFAASSGGPDRWQPLELHPRDRRVVVGRETRQLAPADFAFYALLVRRRLDERDFVTWSTEGLAGEYLREYRRLAHCLDGNRERVEERLYRHGVDRPWFEERKCKVNRAVRPLGEWAGRDYGIVSRGRRPNTLSGVIVDPRCIRFH